MTLKIEYALLKEFPLPRIISALENAQEEPPADFVQDCEKISSLISGKGDDKIMRDIAKLLITTPAITSHLLMKTPGLEKVVSLPVFTTAIDFAKIAGAGALSIAEQKAEQRNPLLSRFLKIFQEELVIKS